MRSFNGLTVIIRKRFNASENHRSRAVARCTNYFLPDMIASCQLKGQLSKPFNFHIPIYSRFRSENWCLMYARKIVLVKCVLTNYKIHEPAGIFRTSLSHTNRHPWAILVRDKLASFTQLPTRPKYRCNQVPPKTVHITTLLPRSYRIKTRRVCITPIS